MTDVEPTSSYPVYAHSLISWSAVIIGAAAAIALGVLMNLLVAAFDGAATLSELRSSGQVGDNAMLLGVFGALANLVALFIGGFIAARCANHPDHHDGLLHGLGVWAIAFLVAFALLGSGANRAIGTALSAAPDMAAPAAASPNETGAMAGAATPSVTPDLDRRARSDAALEAQGEAADIAKVAEQTAFFGFAAMLVGLVAALVGGSLGARHPEHFAVRPRYYRVRP